MSKDLITYLTGGDLRSIAKVEELLPLVRTQSDFDELFKFLYSKDRLIVMRTADALEKLTTQNPRFLFGHKEDILHFIDTARDKEFKWHLSSMVSRLKLTNDELQRVWKELTKWAKDKRESRIVRVHSIQSLFDLAKQDTELQRDLKKTAVALKKENIPSIQARLRILGM
ncbi:hypothetical protein SAMN06265375_10151 [Muriicola jejuensis]|uniref:HEAT repeat domain-containing protein n=1 Tax=Muriicola jejuensis TaxID=504488 RepID=A0A6P0UB36_9FLAO|nr:hypothetical protein [Muriicola jejuensis]NER10404.1 hypothetical protein [Muriicola jejuensis]SMP00933.1 hypothetical protein SAMN06265375_10151 [Muriicola jejuensis]